jgi:phenylalanyl-tRNA synthetase beta subunit
MDISYQWLQEYFDQDLPPANELAELLTMHAYEVEEVIERGGHTVLDIDVLPNRAADSLCHVGVAREVATLLGAEAEVDYQKPKADDAVSSEASIDLDIASDHVRRATKRLVTDVAVAESSDEIKEKLRALDQQPINNIVDLTNYVMLATGQPVHAFDYDKLAGDAPKDIVIREAESGETIETLDSNEYELEKGMLVIADSQKPLDIAGIKGGMNSHIDEDTERVMLSVCSFDPAQIRQTSQQLNLRTDASKRFENNISPETVRPALDYLSALIEEHADGTVAADVCEACSREANRYTTGVSTDRVNDLLGTDISQDQAKEILERCHCEVDIVDPIKEVLEHAQDYEGSEYERGASVSFHAPDKFDCSSYTSFLFSQHGGVSIPRISVDQFMYGDPVDEEDMQPGDLIFYNTGERIIHYETQEFMPGTPVEEGIDHPALYLGDSRIISATSYTGEVTITDIENPEFGERIGVRRMAEGERLRVQVPYWRQDLRHPEDLVEEIGRVHGYESITETVPSAADDKPPVHKTFYYTQKIHDILTNSGLSEVYTYAFQNDGVIELTNPIAEGKQYLRASLKPGLKKALQTNEKHKELLDGQEISIFEVGKVFQEHKEVLQLGLATTGSEELIHDAVQEIKSSLDVEINSDLTDDTSNDANNIFTINIDPVLEQLNKPESYDHLQTLSTDVTYVPPSQFPYVLRDIAFWAPEVVKGRKSNVESLLEEAAGELLVNIKLFDEYDPDDSDQVSLAYRLVFQSDQRTLEDKDVNEIMDKVHAAVEEEGWEVR